ncbi:hypothetical protein [Siccirubricoccus sp. G192]|uniref:hypothetical protein n=1 Tax=Siccirubricoccus sp. G192 TaxID=2849651 RepID=UPI001C2B943D|nr:hypothetical protein [Siccirubricoccus sp. G192]MBV1797149.1 hypothetical protein [Siccirubricoccus sp. G192]
MMRPTNLEELLQEREFIPQAILLRPISDFARRLDIQATEGDDDLDYYQGVGLLLEGTIPVAIICYRGHPPNTSTVYLPFEMRDPKLISAIIGMITNAFDIPAEAVSWQRSSSGEHLAS